MKALIQYWLAIFKRSIRLWLDAHAGSYAGSLAFFTLFSLAPVIILAVKVISLVMASETAMTQVLAQLEATVGPEAAREVQNAIANQQSPGQGLLAGLLSLLAMIIGATTVFSQMQRAMNAIWEVIPKPSHNSLLLILKSRLLSLTTVVALGFVLLVSLLLNVAVHGVLAYAESWLPIPAAVVLGPEILVSLLVITLLFAALFRLLPDMQLRWPAVLPAALVTAVLFSLGRTLIALYLSHTATASSYGAAGSLVVLMLWVYYSSMILLFGAAFSRAHCEARRISVAPRRTAIRVRREHLDPLQQP